MSRLFRGTARRVVLGLVTLMLLIVAWEIIGRLQLVAFVLPFTDALQGAYHLVTGPRLWIDVIPSMVRAVLGFILGSLGGYAIGLILGLVPILERWTRPALEIARATPVPILIPIVYSTLGANDMARIGLIGLAAMWPVLLNTVDGVRAVDARLIDAGRVAGLDEWARLRRVIIPAAMPQVFAGLRIALGLSLVMMVVSEMISANAGLGQFVLQAQRSFAISNMYSGVLVLATLGGVLSLLFNLVEHRTLGWYHRQKGRVDV